MHHRGTFTAWSREAAELGLQLFAYRAGVEVETLAEFILEAFSYWMTVHLMHRLLRHQLPGLPDFPAGPADRALFDMLADRSNIQGLTLQAHFDNPLVAIGAPAQALAGEAARKLGATLLVPEHADVANAVGAITGTLTIVVEARITPDEEAFTVHSPTTVRHFADLDSAKAWAGEHLLELLEARLAVGYVDGFHYHRDVQCIDRNGTSLGGSLFLECLVRATAVGRPEFASFALA
jgi:hypothetical protein